MAALGRDAVSVGGSASAILTIEDKDADLSSILFCLLDESRKRVIAALGRDGVIVGGSFSANFTREGVPIEGR